MHQRRHGVGLPGGVSDQHQRGKRREHLDVVDMGAIGPLNPERGVRHGRVAIVSGVRKPLAIV
jgi:hypothetical protein